MVQAGKYSTSQKTLKSADCSLGQDLLNVLKGKGIACFLVSVVLFSSKPIKMSCICGFHVLYRYYTIRK